MPEKQLIYFNPKEFKALRERKGWSQQWLADRAKVSVWRIKDYENLKKKGGCHRTTYIKLADVMDWEDIKGVVRDGMHVVELLEEERKLSSSVQKQTFDLPDNLPSIRNWVGRLQELEELQVQVFNPETRAVVITGSAIGVIGSAGIGKTILASKLVRLLQEQNAPFVAVAWESLRPNPGIQKPPRFDLIIDSLLFTLSGGKITAAVTAQDEYRQKTERIVRLLQNKPCFVVLDNVETTLQTGDSERAGYFAVDNPEFAWLFKELVEREHQSKILFTSRERLDELPRVGYYSRELGGLDREAAVALLRPFDLIATDEELEELVDRYEGHPKALELAATLILDDHRLRGQVGRFLQDHQWLLIQSIENMIDQVIQRLSDKEKICLSRISVYQTREYPLLLDGFIAQMPEVDEYELRNYIVKALEGRQLLDYNAKNKSYQLHPLTQEKAYRILRPNFNILNPECQESHRRAYNYFLSIPINPESEWKGVENIKPLLQAHYHACQAEDWDEAAEAIERFGYGDSYLYQWGEFRLLIDLLKHLLPSDQRKEVHKLHSPEVQGEVLNSISFAYGQIGEFQSAIGYGQQALYIAKEIVNREIEGRSLYNLALAYRHLGQYQIAVEYLQKSLTISQKFGDRGIEGRIQSNLGIIYRHLGQYQAAIKIFLQALSAAREIGDRGLEGRVLSNMSLVYHDMKEYETAIVYGQQSLSII